jgi:23S rRNA pseudouridine1911/1915/1917 synthase
MTDDWCLSALDSVSVVFETQEERRCDHSDSEAEDEEDEEDDEEDDGEEDEEDDGDDEEDEEDEEDETSYQANGEAGRWQMEDQSQSQAEGN